VFRTGLPKGITGKIQHRALKEADPADHRFRLASDSFRDGAGRRSYAVAIIGAGFGGLGMAARLKESGED
jgi:NADH dehydrogenase FAD-containing subunit